MLCISLKTHSFFRGAVQTVCAGFILIFTLSASAETRRYRLVWSVDPATTVDIGWEHLGLEPGATSDAVVHYGEADHGTDYGAYPRTGAVAHTVWTHEQRMNHTFARLTELKPDTAYYFVIRDGEDLGPRLWFRTAPAEPGQFAFIAGGDSRNRRNPRRAANMLVAKLRPLFVAFGGDFTGKGSYAQWAGWLDDWQLTISPDGRMAPLVPARGNHDSAASMAELFNVEGGAYYSLGFGGTQLRTYTLNSEIAAGGRQRAWLEEELARFGPEATFQVAQYHKPMRPHTAAKAEGDDEYTNWAGLFYTHGMDLVVECDSHMVKRTYPLRPDTGEGSEEGFVRDDDGGTVYIGEGCWGAPLRSPDDAKGWTRAIASFNQLNWIHVYPEAMKVHTVILENSFAADAVREDAPFDVPAGVALWEPESGAVLTVPAREP